MQINIGNLLTNEPAGWDTQPDAGGPPSCQTAASISSGRKSRATTCMPGLYERSYSRGGARPGIAGALLGQVSSDVIGCKGIYPSLAS
jgi:hypothetical protein